MNNDILEIKVALQISRTPLDVYEAIVDPEKMSNYFISKGSGRMEPGKSITWKFPEFNLEFPVRVGKVEEGKYISYFWDVNDNELMVEIMLAAQGNGSTVVTVVERGMKNDEAGINWLKGNTEGWAGFLACLKAYLEYGINLRKGAFDFRAGEF
jgi:uncharacterized protein YndB with AHSA1/START domain